MPAATTLPDLDIFGPEFTADPHPILRALREQGWAARSLRGIEVLTYAKCEAILADERFADGTKYMMEFLGEGVMDTLVGPGRTLTTTEGAEHTALRRAVTPWFTPKRVRELRTRTRALVDRLLDGVEAAGTCDFMADIAERIPGAVFCWMVGAPESDGDRLSEWSATLLKAFNTNPDDVPDIQAASAELTAYCRELVAAKRAVPGDDVTSTLLQAVDAGTITEDDVVSLLNEMFAASTDNTSHSAGMAVWLLLSHPEQWQRLVDDPALIPGAVEECGRYGTRVSAIAIHTPETIELDGVEFPAGTLSWLNIASAHRDPAVFADPDRFDVGRTMTKGQLSFGFGRHFCIGAALARMELQVILEAVTERWRSPVLVGEANVQHVFSGSIDSLKIAFTPATG
jgi:cytochrome P450